jgi:predicted DNA-binding transcriptional regulator YafY
MSDRITKLQRWIDLIAFLASHRYPVSLEQISRHVPSYRDLRPEDGSGPNPSAQREFERDKAELKRLGIHIISEMRVGESVYRLSTEEFTLPIIRLVTEAQIEPYGEAGRLHHGGGAFGLEIEERDASIVAAALRGLASQPGSPLRAAARSALRKLSFDLPDHVVASLLHGDQTDTVIQIEDPELMDGVELMSILHEALQYRKTVHMLYRSMRRGEERWRFVDPWGLLNEGGKWYLIGRDRDADALRMFRVGRILRAEPNHLRPRKPDFEVPADFRISDWAGRHPWQYGPSEIPMEEVRVHLRFPRSRWAERNRLGKMVLEHSDGDQERSFSVRDADAFARWVLGMAGEATILSPPHMVTRVRDLARTVRARHQAVSATEATA